LLLKALDVSPRPDQKTSGNCVYVTLHAIFPSIAHVHDPFSSDVTMTGGRLIGFSIGWLITLSCCWVPFHKFQKLVIIKGPIMIFFIFAFFIWVIVKGKGVGATMRAPTKVPAGTSHGWVSNSTFIFFRRAIEARAIVSEVSLSILGAGAPMLAVQKNYWPMSHAAHGDILRLLPHFFGYQLTH